jgi:hypothetical protein
MEYLNIQLNRLIKRFALSRRGNTYCHLAEEDLRSAHVRITPGLSFKNPACLASGKPGLIIYTIHTRFLLHNHAQHRAVIAQTILIDGGRAEEVAGTRS